MIRPISINFNRRKVEFKMNLDLAFKADYGMNWYFQNGTLPEPELLYLLFHAVREDDFVIDAGANIGFFSLLMSRIVGDGGSVLAVEPAAVNVEKMRANIGLNHFSNIEILNNPLARQKKTVEFYLQHDSGRNSAWRDHTAVTEEVEVETCTLDDICEDRRIPKLIKLDIEGSEFEALQGGKYLLSMHPPFVVLEINPEALGHMGTSPLEIRDLMQKHGYEMFALNENGRLPALIPDSCELLINRLNTNVLFSTLDDISMAWPEVLL